MSHFDSSNVVSLEPGDVVVSLTRLQLDGRGLSNGKNWRWAFIRRPIFVSMSDLSSTKHSNMDKEIIGIVHNYYADGMMDFSEETK